MGEMTRGLETSKVRGGFVALFFAAAFGFLYLRTFLLPGTPLAAFGDEVHYFLHAVRMLHGQMPYRDFFTFVPPGTDVLYAGVFRVLGVHQWVAQGLVIAVGMLLAGVVTWLSAKVLRGPAVMLPGLLFLVVDFDGALDATHHWWSTLLVLCAAGIAMGGRGKRRVVAAGALCGLAALFTQTHGGVGLVALAVWLVWTAEPGGRGVGRDVAAMLLGFAAVFGAGMGYFAYVAGLRTVAYWIFYYPAVYFSTLDAHTPGAYFLEMPRVHGLEGLLAAAPYLLVHAAVPLVYALCLIRVVRDKETMDREERARVLLLCLAGVGLFLAVVSAATFLRLCVIAAPAMILCAWYCDRVAWARRGLWTLGVGLMVVLAVSRQRHGGERVEMPTGRAAFSNARQAEKMRWLAERTRAGDSFFGDPGAAFSLGLESAGPLDYVTPGEFTRPEQVAATVRAMEERRTQFVFVYPELYVARRSGDNLGPLRGYLEGKFRVVKEFPSGEIWERVR